MDVLALLVIFGFVVLLVLGVWLFTKLLPFIALLLALFNDFLDFMGIGCTPIVGDLIDITTGALLMIAYGVPGAIALLELIPGIDILPIMIITGIVCIWYKYRR